MSAETVPEFTASAGEAATVHRTDVSEFPETLAAAIDPPAVGMALPIEGINLERTDVAADPSPSEVRAARTGVTPASAGVANYGTVTLPSVGLAEVISLYCERHVAVLAASDVVPDMPAAYERLSEEFAAGTDTQVLATGPSSTADMGELIQGVHGPVETHVVLVEDR